MLIEPMYYAVFFLNGIPKHKRILRSQWINLTDGIIEKTVELESIKYVVISIKTFNILNSVDNTHFAICDIQKV